MVACGHDVHRWEKLTDQDADYRDHNEAAGHCIQLIVPQLSVQVVDGQFVTGSVVGLAHDRLKLAGVNGVAQGIELVAAAPWAQRGREEEM